MNRLYIIEHAHGSIQASPSASVLPTRCVFCNSICLASCPNEYHTAQRFAQVSVFIAKFLHPRENFRELLHRIHSFGIAHHYIVICAPTIIPCQSQSLDVCHWPRFWPNHGLRSGISQGFHILCISWFLKSRFFNLSLTSWCHNVWSILLLYYVYCMCTHCTSTIQYHTVPNSINSVV